MTEAKVQGQRVFQQPLFVSVDINKLVPKNHLLRRVNKEIDFSFIYELTAPFYCLNNGRPSLDPELFLRMTVISYLYNVASDRQLCDEIGYNLAYRWFCKLSLADTVPDHCTLTVTRDRFGEETFRKIFQRVVQLCIDKGLVDGTSVMTDSMLIMANASMDSMVPKEGQIFNVRRQKELTGKRKLANETHVSTTDPEATLAVKPNSPRGLKYKAHTTIDTESRVIVDCHVTTGATHDSSPYISRLDEIKRDFPEITVAEAVADRAYGAGAVLESLEERGIESFIPLFHCDTGLVSEKTGATYDSKNDCFVCLGGKSLYPGKVLGGTHKRYSMSDKNCIGCQLQAICKAKRRIGSRYINRSIYQRQFDEVLKKKESPKFKRLMRERLWKIEGINSEAKLLHGLNRVRYRSRWKAQVQAFMTAMVQNIKRLINFADGRFSPAMAEVLVLFSSVLAVIFAFWSRNSSHYIDFPLNLRLGRSNLRMPKRQHGFLKNQAL